jgi:hypothetical protein
MMRVYRITIPATVVRIWVPENTNASDELPKIVFKSDEPED